MGSDPAQQPLAPVTVAAIIGASGACLCTRPESLPDELLSFHPSSQDWCVNEVIGHLVEAERRGLSGRIREMIDVDDSVMEPWDQAKYRRV